MNFLPLLEAKRDGRELRAAQIQKIIRACAEGRIPDYQLAAFLMAVYFRGLSGAETRALTLAMRDSGEVLAFPADSRPLVDKHSTGGVGDKISLVLAPLLACLGCRVPMISGRGLGITGGTLDKLEAIPGFQTTLPVARLIEIVQTVGCVICGQTDRMVPADKTLYALRDVTGTVPSTPLIVASILSKKLAENLQALVLDVKFGRAAFMPDIERARELGRVMVRLGNQCGVATRALLSRMDSPIGRTAGNWLEVKEAAACLANPAEPGLEDLRDLVLAAAAQLLVQTGKASTLEDGQAQAEACLATGDPLRKWEEMLAAQGADLAEYRRKVESDHRAAAMVEVEASGAGWVSGCDARLVGEIVRDLGAGRLTKEAAIDHDAGVDRLARIGEHITPGALLARVHAADLSRAKAAAEKLRSAFVLASQATRLEPVVQEVLT